MQTQTQTLGDELRANLVAFKKGKKKKEEAITCMAKDVKAAWDNGLIEMSKNGEVKAKFTTTDIVSQTGIYADHEAIFWKLIELYNSDGVKAVHKGETSGIYGGPFMEVTWLEEVPDV